MFLPYHPLSDDFRHFDPDKLLRLKSEGESPQVTAVKVHELEEEMARSRAAAAELAKKTRQSAFRAMWDFLVGSLVSTVLLVVVVLPAAMLDWIGSALSAWGASEFLVSLLRASEYLLLAIGAILFVTYQVKLSVRYVRSLFGEAEALEQYSETLARVEKRFREQGPLDAAR